MGENEPPDIKSCRECAEPIAGSARKCKICDSYQDWRRFFDFSSPVLALLVALITVTTAAVPVFVHVVRGSYSNLNIAYQRSSERSVSFIASNSGTKPSTVGNAVLHVSYDAEAGNGYDAVGGSLSIPLTEGDSAGLVGAGETKQIVFQLSQKDAEGFREAFPGSEGPPRPANQGPPLAKVESQVIIVILEFGQPPRRVSVPVEIMCFQTCGFR